MPLLNTHHLLVMKLVGHKCSCLPNHVKAVVWSFLRDPLVLEVVRPDGLLLMSMQTGQLLQNLHSPRQRGESSAAYKRRITGRSWPCETACAMRSWGFSLTSEPDPLYFDPHYQQMLHKQHCEDGFYFVVNRPRMGALGLKQVCLKHNLDSPPCSSTWPEEADDGLNTVLWHSRGTTWFDPDQVLFSRDTSWAIVCCSQTTLTSAIDMSTGHVIEIVPPTFKESDAVEYDAFETVHLLSLPSSLIVGQGHRLLTWCFQHHLTSWVLSTRSCGNIEGLKGLAQESWEVVAVTWPARVSLFEIGRFSGGDIFLHEVGCINHSTQFPGLPAGPRRLVVQPDCSGAMEGSIIDVWSFVNGIGQAQHLHRLDVNAVLARAAPLNLLSFWPGVGPSLTDLLQRFEKLQEVEESEVEKESDVIQTVIDEFSEPVAVIPPGVADSLSHELWASGVESLVNSNIDPHAGCGQISRVHVVLLEFSRGTKQLEDAILTSPPGCRAAEQNVQVQPAWAHGAKVLVAEIGPEQFSQTFNGFTLRPKHVIVYEDDLDELLASLASLNYSIRKLKPDGKHVVSLEQEAVADGLSLIAVSTKVSDSIDNDAGNVIEITVHNTFIDFRERHLAGSTSAYTV